MSERILLSVALRGHPELEADLDVPPGITPANLLRMLQAQANWPGGKYSVETLVSGARLETDKPLHASNVRQGEKIIFYHPQGAATPPKEAGWPLVVPREARPVPVPAWRPPVDDLPDFKPQRRSGIDWSDTNVRRLAVLIGGILLIYLTLLIVWIVVSLRPKPPETRRPLGAPRAAVSQPVDPAYAGDWPSPAGPWPTTASRATPFETQAG